MFWVIVGVVFLAYVIIKAVDSHNQTSVNIANAKLENDYYNSLSEKEKIAYNQQKNLVNEQNRQQELIKSKVKLYQHIYKTKFGGDYARGKGDNQVAENQKTQLLAQASGINIGDGDDVRKIMLSADFLAANFLTASLQNMINDGLDDAKISKKFARKNEHNGLINNSSKWSNSKLYAPDDIAYLREVIQGHDPNRGAGKVLSNWGEFNNDIDELQETSRKLS